MISLFVTCCSLKISFERRGGADSMALVLEQGGAEEPLGVVWSDQCAWTDLMAPVQVTAGRSALDLDDDWARRWTATWRTGAGEVSCAVRDLNGMVVSGRPMRRFSWRREQHDPRGARLAA
ncbi:hypothetical protein [Streptomyces sp. NPDC102437]|uniref:hypothetical protein n=1 Tax=Streptomyces sp. NPDC102437 TaxID=3366175 RepID=UPI00382AB447